MTIPKNHENIKKFCNATNKEKKYLTNQMIDNRFYKISDIITDVPVEHILSYAIYLLKRWVFSH